MARINIEDSIFREKAFEKLVLRLGSRRAALGALVEAFMLAQKHYLTTVNDRLIPLNEWEREEMGNDLLDCGFCVQREKGIYVRGSEEQFKWLLQRSEAGKTSARNKQHLAENPVERPLNDRQTTADGSQPLTLTLPLSPTLSLSQNSVSNNSVGADVLKSTRPPDKFDAKSLNDVLTILGEEKANAWRELYNGDDEFIIRELRKAWQYYHLDNPAKKPKSKRGWSQTLSSWLERGWGFAAKNTKGNTQKSTKGDDIRKMLSDIEEGKL